MPYNPSSTQLLLRPNGTFLSKCPSWWYKYCNPAHPYREGDLTRKASSGRGSLLGENLRIGVAKDV